MSRYELADHDVDVILQQLRERGSGMTLEIAERLSMQIPIPVPVKIGAVVKTDSALGSAWVLVYSNPVSWATPTDPSGHLYRTDQIGRITEVLSPGVDL